MGISNEEECAEELIVDLTSLAKLGSVGKCGC